jgi:hypothetical protein
LLVIINYLFLVKFEAILQYLIAPPDLYQTEGGVAGDHGESTDSKIMREALALQTSNLSVNTKNQYKTHLRKFLVNGGSNIRRWRADMVAMELIQ